MSAKKTNSVRGGGINFDLFYYHKQPEISLIQETSERNTSKMATAGPELPPHLLAKRKRLEEVEVEASAQASAQSPDESLRSPPNGKPRRSRSNSVSSNSDGAKRRRVLGPSLHESSTSDRIASEHDHENSKAGNGRARSDDYDSPRPSRILGPSLPPASLSTRPSSPPNPKDPHSSDDDDDFGPALPQTSTHQSRLPESSAESPLPSDQSPAKPKREEWMLILPSQSDWSSRVDPTKLRNRKFNTGKGAKAPPPKSSGDNALWTETPEQKQKRLTDEIMGVVAKPGSAIVSASTDNGVNEQKRTEALETERRIEAYNAQYRPASLYSEHQKGPRKEQEDDPSARAFDREKDVVRGTKIGRAQRQEMLTRAADFGERFTKGSYL